MKKNGFTLAEVLVTLGIIGVVSTLTLPALMSDVDERQYIASLKKGINTLTNAVDMNDSLYDFDFDDITEFGNPKESAFETGSDTPKRTIAAIMLANAAVDLQKSTATQIVFRDGTSIMPVGAGVPGCTKHGDIKKCTTLIFDANGPKGPNKVHADGGYNGKGMHGLNEKAVEINDRFYITVGGKEVYAGNEPVSSFIFSKKL